MGGLNKNTDNGDTFRRSGVEGLGLNANIFVGTFSWQKKVVAAMIYDPHPIVCIIKVMLLTRAN